MDIKQKTAAIATLANILLTIAKFVMYSYTGSLAILSEAWHSLSDIATSLLVWAALRRKESTADGVVPPPSPVAAQQPPTGDMNGESPGNQIEASSSPEWQTGVRRFFSSICLEEVSSILIAVLLFSVSYRLFGNIFTMQTTVLTNTLTAGILFFICGLGSYTVARFETQIGIEQQSVGLTSDGLHSKSDMIASFLTGASLIAYHAGLDLDRPVSFLIALLILALAVEVLVMVYTRRFPAAPSDRPSLIPEFRTYRLLLSAVDPIHISHASSWFSEFLHSRMAELPVIGFVYRHARLLLLGLLIVGYLGTALVIVEPTERAIIERFGSFQAGYGLLEPGLHLKLPWPCETAHFCETERVFSLNVGTTANPNEKAFVWAREHGDVQPFLSGDNNFLYPYLAVLYKVDDPVVFFNGHSQPVDILQKVCLRVLTETLVGKPLYSIFTADRKTLVNLLSEKLQQRMDDLKVGIRVLAICLKDVHPPISVASAYEAVVSAEQTKQTTILAAQSHRNTEIPDTRASAENVVQAAETYKLQRIHDARGEGSRFHSTEKTFQKTRAVTKQRLYLETMQKALRSARLILIDKKAGMPGLLVHASSIATVDEEDLPDISSDPTSREVSETLPALPDLPSLSEIPTMSVSEVRDGSSNESEGGPSSLPVLPTLPNQEGNE